jgi:ADP-heptose:LPS heptosyltransferase
LRPDHADAHFNLGRALQAQERHVEAILHFEKTMALLPNVLYDAKLDDAKLYASFSYLYLGRFAEGLDPYEHRWTQKNIMPPRDYSSPRWDGKPVPGVMLVWAEQGLGDQILYAGLLPDLKRYAEKVVVEVDRRLVDLFARSFPDIDLVGYDLGPYRGRIDAHAPFGSLAKHLRKGWGDFPPRHNGYLLADSGQAKDLRARLRADGRRVIGLSWISRNAKFGRFKSAQLKDFQALLKSPGYRFVDLQYGDTAAERNSIERELGVRVERLDEIDNMNDIDGLAALVSACDAVLTVSNTTAHLAGALGTPTWVMVPFGRGVFWYWFWDRPASPWYARVQVRRQESGQCWADLIAAVAAEIN